MKEKVASISIFANVVLAAGKIIVGLFSHSAAILAEGIHSFMDIFSSTISYIGIKLSKKPADEKHPYGHFKYEVLTGTVITVILFVTGAGIIYEAYKNLLDPQILEIGWLAFTVMAVSAIINEIMARLKIKYGKKENSISLLSDGYHSRIDVFTSLAVFVGLILAKYWLYTDTILAILIGIYIIYESFVLGKEAIDSLLDISAGEEIENKIKSIVQDEKINLASLKTQKKGSALTANLEIDLPGNLAVDQASKIADDLRSLLMIKIENMRYVVIQIKSHALVTSYYKPNIGAGYGWQRRGRFEKKVEGATGDGPGGDCVCPKCGYLQVHQRGTPCSKLICPKCHTLLERKENAPTAIVPKNKF